jgi:hypothetical protein
MGIGPSTYESIGYTFLDRPEDVEVDGQYHAMKLLGDRVLALVGDERTITLTDEEVCCTFF